MEKLVYLLWAPPSRSGEEVARILLDECAPAIVEAGAAKLSINVDDAQADVRPPVPTPDGEWPLVGEVSVWLECHDRRAAIEAILERAEARTAGYLVTESLYTDYGGNRHAPPRDWADGTRSPGVLTVTLLRKPDRLTDEAWFAHWYGVQSPVSESIQPRSRYVRNAVARPLTPDAPPIRGIVDEAWPSAEHVTDPLLFYLADGNPDRMREHVERMMESVTGFLDLQDIRTTTMSEYLVLS